MYTPASLVTPMTIDYIPSAGGSGLRWLWWNVRLLWCIPCIYFNQDNTVSETILRVDNKLFDVASEKMIWSGKTESLNPKSATKLITEFEQKVIRDMRKNGFID